MRRFFATLPAALVLARCVIPPEADYLGGKPPRDAATDVADGAEPGDSPGSGCVGSHLYYSGGSCYRFAADALPWGAAESDCVAWGGHLVAIKDGIEQTFVGETIVDPEVALLSDAGPSPGAWIGLNDVKATGAYVWTTGQPLSFVNWGTKAPTGNPCVHMYNAKFAHSWDDFVCSARSPYVCER